MSAADPARPRHPGPAVLAPVLPITAARPRRHPSSERTSVPLQPDGTLTPHQRIAARLEHLLSEIGRTLTDEATADGLRVGLSQARLLLDGARKQGLITKEAYEELDGMLAAMMEAPGLIG
ncbi:hypothetical protein [Streptomyces griseorubiginosus]|uniref:hypothetical protein n=1 Tax=Streptomyces griseorubiginosus TaxID=67304 RepID=UPI00331FF4DE